MSELLEKLARCIEFGKINRLSPYPPDMKGTDGADELAGEALKSGIGPERILSDGLVAGISRIGVKFRRNEVFVPEVLMAAKAMAAGMKHLEPFFRSGEVKTKGTFVIGTAMGDLHDIGKRIVAMMVEGGGWKVVDLGVDVQNEQFLDAIEDNPGCAVGLSALLTTSMANMESAVKAIKDNNPATKILIGGAPVSQKFCDAIGADFYAAGPLEAVDILNKAIVR